MQDNTRKKIFVVGNVTYALVKGNRWYVEHYTFPLPEVPVRHRDYGGLNRIKDLEAREAAAVALIERIATCDITQPATSMLQAKLEAMRPHLRPKTYSTYRSKLRGWLAWLDDVPDTLATWLHARSFIKSLIGEHSDTTVKSYHQTLQSLYNGLPCANPFIDVKTAPAQKKSKKPFTENQAAALLPRIAGDPALHLAVNLLFYCYIRPGETRQLMVDDIDLDRGFIEVRAEISKNKKTQQVIIPDAFKTMLATAIGDRCGGPLIMRRGAIVGRDYFYKQHKELERQLNITGRYSLYSWKHTGVVKAVQAGINLKYLQLQLRHHSLDQLNEYLKDLGLADCGDLASRFPAIEPISQSYTLEELV